MNVRFIIEHVNADGAHGFVQASIVEGTSFAVSRGSLLGGARLRSALHEQSADTYVFELENGSEASKLTVGSIVEIVR